MTSTLAPLTFVADLPPTVYTDWATVAAHASARPGEWMAAKRLECRQGLNKERLAVHQPEGRVRKVGDDAWIFVRYVGSTPEPTVAPSSATEPPPVVVSQQRTGDSAPLVRCCGLPERLAS